MAWGGSNNSKYVEFLWRLLQYSQVFKRFKIEAYYLPWKCCHWKDLSKNVWYGALAPKGRPQMPNLLRFWVIFRAFPFPAPPQPLRSHPSLFLSPLSHFTQRLLFPKKVNKKLSYRGQNEHLYSPQVVECAQRDKNTRTQYRQRTYTAFIRMPVYIEWPDA